MGWQRLVGSLKLSVSSTEYCLFYRALLLKRPTILRSQLIAATPFLGTIKLNMQDYMFYACVLMGAWPEHDRDFLQKKALQIDIDSQGKFMSE